MPLFRFWWKLVVLPTPEAVVPPIEYRCPRSSASLSVTLFMLSPLSSCPRPTCRNRRVLGVVGVASREV